MSLTDNGSNHFSSNRSDKLSSPDSANQDSGFSRREFFGMAAASFLIKTSHNFDGTYANPQWLG